MDTFKIKEIFSIPSYDDPDTMQMGELIVDKDKCKECGICVSLCPGGCLVTDRLTKMQSVKGAALKGKQGIPYLMAMRTGVTLCIACFDCGAACPHGAIGIKHNFNPGRYFRRLTQTAEMRYPKRY